MTKHSKPNIGDIFNGFWALDFFQVVKKTEKTVLVRKIAYGGLYENYQDTYPASLPMRNEFIGESFRASLQFDDLGFWTGEIASCKIEKQTPSGSGIATLWTKPFIKLKADN
jgi:hypothetical protein